LPFKFNLQRYNEEEEEEEEEDDEEELGLASLVGPPLDEEDEVRLCTS
jgi:hypothetical protein